MRLTFSVLLASSLCGATARATQCPDWTPGFHRPGVSDIVSTLLAANIDGTPRLYLGGDFTRAGEAFALHVASWDGSSWSALGAGLNKAPAGFATFDDGSGPALYACGDFQSSGGQSAVGVAKWDGAAWSSVGGGVYADVYDLEVFDDGSGTALYAAGLFGSAGGVSARGIARWNGSAWSAVGTPTTVNSAFALAVHDDGSGPALYAAGDFAIYGGTNSYEIARWDGTSWTLMGRCTTYAMYTLASLPTPNGQRLFVGGAGNLSIDGTSPTSVVMWNGLGWVALGAMVGQVRALANFDAGQGPELHAGGWIADGIARWNGVDWIAPTPGVDNIVNGLAVFDAGAGDRLWVGGGFELAGALAVENLAGWDGTSWHGIEPTGNGFSGGDVGVLTLAALDIGSGEQLYAGGDFTRAGEQEITCLAKWNGGAWEQLGNGLTGVIEALDVFDDGSGRAVCAAGAFRLNGQPALLAVAEWDGAAWSALPILSGAVRALKAFDDGSGAKLYVAGTPGLFAGSCIARWNGSSWLPVGAGLSGGAGAFALEVFDDGSGPVLYAGGSFTLSGASSVARIARWDGANWQPGGAGLSGEVRALATFNGELVAGGVMSSLGNLARWNGTSWSMLGSGTNADVYALTVHDDGLGSALFVGGAFMNAGGATARKIARWNGANWSSLSSGVSPNDGWVDALCVLHDGLAPNGSLYVGGEFQGVGGRNSARIARWTDACACGGRSYCTAGTTSSGCVATISAIGRASASAASSFELHATNIEGDKQGLFFYGLSGTHAAPWGGGQFLCVKAPTQRTPVASSGGTLGGCDGALALDWNAFLAAHPTALGAPFTAGSQVWAQAYFRDPPSAKTTALTDGLSFYVCP